MLKEKIETALNAINNAHFEELEPTDYICQLHYNDTILRNVDVTLKGYINDPLCEGFGFNAVEKLTLELFKGLSVDLTSEDFSDWWCDDSYINFIYSKGENNYHLKLWLK